MSYYLLALLILDKQANLALFFKINVENLSCNKNQDRPFCKR